MRRWEKTTMEIRELLGRVQKRQSNHEISPQMKINRKTVACYQRWAKDQGLLQAALPSIGELTDVLEDGWNPSTPP
ncbi:MAG: hypothetical protein WHS46_10975 [Desulfosoma sp.]